MDFYFEKHLESEDTYEKVNVHVTLDSDTNMAKFDVDMDSIPGSKLDGYEVIVDFTIQDFNNNQEFYTDSNGLEMQKRVLNYRPTFDLQKDYKEGFENVTANYFPINTAISMKEQGSSRQFTVCNDRAQAGSALTQGGIQFM